MMGSQKIYFARYADAIKIGCSINPERRIAQVGEWLPEPLVLLATMPGNYSLESVLHDAFADEWSHGEWFHASDRLLKTVEDVKSGRSITIDATSVNTARRQMIADKKRMTRRLSKLGIYLPEKLTRAIYSPEAKGRPYPQWVADELNALISAKTELVA